jgi:xanthine/CO dehydrogenase XdhC/CoxF family maturation factor
MKELWEIIEALGKLKVTGERAALATVVRVEGSAYRREGAKLLISETGQMIGNISGGCLEGDVVESTKRVIDTDEPALRHYDLMGEEDLVWGFGLGCNGRIDVFIEPVKSVQSGLEAVNEAFERDVCVTIATVSRAPSDSGLALGAKLLVRSDGSKQGSLGVASLDESVINEALDMMKTGKSRMLFYNPTSLSGPPSAEPQEVGVYADCFIPPPKLVVFGGGPDALPLVRLGREAGFKVTVIDHRPAYAAPERFPEASNVILARPEELPDKLTLGERSYAVVVSHNFGIDAKVLGWLLESQAAYIGLLGPRDRMLKMLANLKTQGYEPDETKLQRVHSPVGLDIGAQGPEQIALAIIGEILAVKNNRSGALLKGRQQPIHS